MIGKTKRLTDNERQRILSVLAKGSHYILLKPDENITQVLAIKIPRRMEFS